jgi:hypothetical protein
VSAAIEADPTPRSPLQRLVFILRTVLQMQVDKGALTPRPWSPEILQVLCSRAEIVELLQSHESIILELVRAGIIGGEINAALDPAMVVRAFYAFINTLHLPVMSQMNDSKPAAVTETLATMFERGVRAPAA